MARKNAKRGKERKILSTHQKTGKVKTKKGKGWEKKKRGGFVGDVLRLWARNQLVGGEERRQNKEGCPRVPKDRGRAKVPLAREDGRFLLRTFKTKGGGGPA